MEPEILWTRQGHYSRRLKARNTRNAQHLAALQQQFPERFIYDHTSPSQVFMNGFGFLLSDGIRQGITDGVKLFAQKEKSNLRRKENRMRVVSRQTARSRREMRLVNNDDARRRAVSILWRNRRQTKLQQIEDACYATDDEFTFSSGMGG